MPSWLWPESRANSSVVVRLGRLVHWTCYGLVVLSLVLMIVAAVAWGYHGDGEGVIVAVLVLALVAGIGRAARYVLANE